MKRELFTIWVLLMVVGLSILAAPALAHHGRGQTYDMQGQVTLKGTVSEVSWRNPHVVIYIDVPDEDGNVVTWGMENSNVVTLARQGYHRNTLQVGQEITAILNPAASGSPVGLVVAIILEDGTEIMSRRRGNPLD